MLLSGSQLRSLLTLDAAFEVGSNHAILMSLQVQIEEFKLAPPAEKEADDAAWRYVEELNIVLQQCESVHTFEISVALFSTHHHKIPFLSKRRQLLLFPCSDGIRSTMQFLYPISDEIF